jgi:hypothetical protein
MGKGEEVIPKASRIAQFTRSYPSYLEAYHEFGAGLRPCVGLVTNSLEALWFLHSFLGLRKEDGHISLSIRSTSFIHAVLRTSHET